MATTLRTQGSPILAHHFTGLNLLLPKKSLDPGCLDREWVVWELLAGVHDGEEPVDAQMGMRPLFLDGRAKALARNRPGLNLPLHASERKKRTPVFWGPDRAWRGRLREPEHLSLISLFPATMFSPGKNPKDTVPWLVICSMCVW